MGSTKKYLVRLFEMQEHKNVKYQMKTMNNNK